MFKDNRRNTNSKGPLFKTVDVLSLAFAAHRVNNGYEKFGQSSFDEKTGMTIVHKYANKDIVKYQITGRFIPSNYIHITVKEQDRQKAVKAKDHFEKYMFNILGGDINDFTQNILDVIFKEEVTKYDLGLLAYIPEMIDRDTKNDSLEELLQKEYLNKLSHINDIRYIKNIIYVQGLFKFQSGANWNSKSEVLRMHVSKRWNFQ